MVLIESVSGFRDFFMDPPEFDILHVGRSQKITDLLQIIFGAMSLILIVFQMSEPSILCHPTKFDNNNSTFDRRSPSYDAFVAEICSDKIMDRNRTDGNKYLILDQHLGWFLAIQIMFLMILTKFIARRDKSKQICRRFTELVENIHGENGDNGNDRFLNQDYMVKGSRLLIKQLRSDSYLTKQHILNSVLCIIFSVIFLGLGTPSTN